MTTLLATPALTTPYEHSAGFKMLEPQLEALVTEITDSALSVEAMRQSFEGSLEQAAAVLRAVPVQEGRATDENPQRQPLDPRAAHSAQLPTLKNGASTRGSASENWAAMPGDGACQRTD